MKPMILLLRISGLASGAAFALLFISRTAFSAPDLDTLISWDLDMGPDAQTAIDSSGTENHGQLGSTPSEDENDPLPIEDGMSGGALRFDGNDFIEVQKPCCLEPDALTIELWIRTQGRPSIPLQYLVVHRPRGCSQGTYGFLVKEKPNNPNSMVLTFAIRTTETKVSLSNSIEIWDDLWNGRWHHIAATFDPRLSGGTAKLYVNGTPKMSTTGNGRIDYTPEENSAFYIGGFGNPTTLNPCDYGFRGDIDGVRLWSRALSFDEIRERSRNRELGADDEQGFPLNRSVEILLGPGRTESCFRFRPNPRKPIEISFTGGSTGNLNQLFIRWGGPAKSDLFDLAALGRAGSITRLMIPFPREDICYGLIQKVDPAAPAAPVIVLIQESELFLESMTAGIAGSGAEKTSSVIRGGGFDGTTAFLLRQSDCEPGACAIFPAKKTLVVASYHAEATFEIVGAPLGLYDLVATKGGGLFTATLPRAFEVKDIHPQIAIEASLRVHRFYRKNDVGRIEILYSNHGDREIPAPLFKLVGPPGAEFRLERDQDYQEKEIQVLGVDRGGMPGMLPPGAAIDQILYYRLKGEDPEATFRLFLFGPGPEELLDWSTVELPPEILPEDQEVVRAGLSVRFGSTWQDYLLNLGALANRLSRRGAEAASVRDLFRFAVREAYGKPSSAILGRMVMAGTGVPLKGLQVVALEAEGDGKAVRSSAVTDGGGSFSIDWLEGGHTYELGIVDSKTGASPVTIPSGEDVYLLDVAAESDPGNGLLPSCPNCDETGLPRSPLSPPEELFREVPDSSQEVRIVSAVDPNEKQGSGGQGDIDLGFVGPGETINYVIHFLNEGDAGVRNLFISDDLDPGLDLSSVQLMDVRIGGMEPVPLDTCLSDQESGYTCGPDQGSTATPEVLGFPVVIDPGNGELPDLSVDIQGTVPAQVGTEGRQIQWAVDLTTPLDPDQSEIGFLMPGQTGYVSFGVTPASDVAEGTEIVNYAEISFDGAVKLTNIVKTTFSLNPRPQLPNSPAPKTGAAVPLASSRQLRWEGDGAVAWDVTVSWLEGGVRKTIQETGLGTKSFCPQGLLPDRTYTWQVTARNSRGFTTAGPEWTFRTLGYPFQRGDSNADGALNLSDALTILFHLFTGSEPPCRKSLDFDGGGSIEITDPVLLLNHLYMGGAAPALPFGYCGLEPAESGLSCEGYPPCAIPDPCR